MAFKSEVWFLVQLNPKDTTERKPLNIGETHVGRNPNADVKIVSEFCSRNHCSFTINDQNEVILKDSSSNGTFVNNINCKNCTRLLKHNDIIGIGCNMDTLDSTDKKYYIYKLMNVHDIPVVGDEIVSLSDDESDTKENVRRQIERCRQRQLDSPVAGPSNIDVDRLKHSPPHETEYENGREDDNDDEYQFYNSQAMFDIKQEISATYSEDMFAENSDESLDGSSSSGAVNNNDEVLVPAPLVNSVDQNDDMVLSMPAAIIKKEVNGYWYPADDNSREEPHRILNEEPIYIDDDDVLDEKCRSWMTILSQNQDKIEKVKIKKEIIDPTELVEEVATEVATKEVTKAPKKEATKEPSKEDAKKDIPNDVAKEDKKRKSIVIEPMPIVKRRKSQSGSSGERSTAAKVQKESKSSDTSSRPLSENENKFKKAEKEPKKISSRRPSAAERLKKITQRRGSACERHAPAKGLTNDQKKKLADLAKHPKDTENRKPPARRLSTTTPKIKVSESRGAFLTEQLPSLAQVRRKSVDERERMAKPSTSSKADESDQKPYETVIVNKAIPKRRISRVNSVKSPDCDDGSVDQTLKYVDHLDPFALSTLKKKEPAVRTLDQAFQQLDKEVKLKAKKIPKRKPEKEEHATTVGPRSILKTADRKKSKRKAVTFNTNLEQVFRFEADEKEAEEDDDGNNAMDWSDEQQNVINNNQHQCDENLATFKSPAVIRTPVVVRTPATVTASAAVRAPAASASSFQQDPTHSIITEITQWNTGWLLNKVNSPPLNGEKFIVAPLLQEYDSYEMYHHTIAPILKLELWANIEENFNQRQQPKPISIILMDVNYEIRGSTRRFVYHCQISGDTSTYPLGTGEFVLVKARENRFFAYVTDVRSSRSGYNKSTTFSMEAAKTVANEELTTNVAGVTITPLTNIRLEIKLFSAVLNLKESPLRNVILNPSLMAEFPEPRKAQKFDYKGYRGLTDSQMKVLERVYWQCLESWKSPSNSHLTLIEGPPGTGKSRLIVDLILQLIFGTENGKTKKILICAASNSAVDLITSKLLKIKTSMTNIQKSLALSIVRFGKLEKMHADVQGISLQRLLQRRRTTQKDAIDSQTISLRKEQTQLNAQIDALSRHSTADSTMDDLGGMKRRLKHITDTINRRLGPNNERDMSVNLLNGANIICTTLSSSINLMQYLKNFDLCIIDEASQCTEPYTLIPLHFNLTSLILVGDTKQLPAVVQSAVARDNNYERSLFARIQEVLKRSSSCNKINSLREQFRMHPDICHFPNQYFYGNKLTTSDAAIDARFPLNAYNVFSLASNRGNSGGFNYQNPGEADFVINIIKTAVKYAKPDKFSYGIITPYSGQRDEIANRLKKSTLAPFNLAVNTIDSYQGQEKDIIIISNTRTSGVGFLSHPKRLNVAMTRARKCLIICGTFTSLKHVPVWRELLVDAESRHCLHTIEDGFNEKSIIKSLVKKTKRSASLSSI